MNIPGISTLYEILKRDIERKNDVLSQRKKLSAELRENAHRWTNLLADTFSKASSRIADDDYRAAEKEIMELWTDFRQVDYKLLEETSPIIQYLLEDERFESYTQSCVRFYKSALDLKRLVYTGIKKADGHDVRLKRDGFSKIEKAWKRELEDMQSDLDREFMKIKVLEPK